MPDRPLIERLLSAGSRSMALLVGSSMLLLGAPGAAAEPGPSARPVAVADAARNLASDWMACEAAAYPATLDLGRLPPAVVVRLHPAADGLRATLVIEPHPKRPTARRGGAYAAFVECLAARTKRHRLRGDGASVLDRGWPLPCPPSEPPLVGGALNPRPAQLHARLAARAAEERCGRLPSTSQMSVAIGRMGLVDRVALHAPELGGETRRCFEQQLVARLRFPAIRSPTVLRVELLSRP